jgi:hypothetical protein
MPMNHKTRIVLGGALVMLWTADGLKSGGTPGSLSVTLCDGETTMQIEQAPATAAGGQAIAATLMAQWQRKHPERPWTMPGSAPAPQDPQKTPDEIIERRHQIQPPFDNSYLLAPGQGEGHAYGSWTKRDLALWANESKKFVVDGARVFHDAKALGSTVSVSCDMCHPDASNTHPETYPKYQVQLGKVVLLRDMINWCLEHPLRAEKMAADDPRMRALEAYILGQRKGTPLAYGKH